VTVPFCIDELRRRLLNRTPIAISARQRASVAIILGHSDGGLLLLLIRRAEHPEDPWSGHMALPGGRRDPSDADDLATAKRETLEEVGLDLSAKAQLLGQLDDIAAVAQGHSMDLAITPFVFNLETVTPVVPTAEVVATYWAPILHLYDRRVETTHQVDLPGGRARLPAWVVEGNVVWGLTYRMVDNLLSLMRTCPTDTTPCP
jgi:8-oxo-dGTP pyrophosphatase MutT (NUDIX family)